MVALHSPSELMPVGVSDTTDGSLIESDPMLCSTATPLSRNNTTTSSDKDNHAHFPNSVVFPCNVRLPDWKHP